ncbi:ATP-dependent RNA helicase DHX58-like [Styela clava]
MELGETINYKFVGNKKEIKVGPVIGDGTQSKIYKGVFAKKFVAVKAMLYDRDAVEVEILRKLDHPNIIKIFFTDKDDITQFIALELCSHTLKQYVEEISPRMLNEIEVLKQITKGLNYLHNGQKYCTVHRDLKPSNILFQYVDREKIWRVKISDFGISKEFYSGKTSTHSKLKGTSGYTAPELLTMFDDVDSKAGKIRKETDMFSLGVIFYYTLSDGHHPFSDNQYDVDAKVQVGEPSLDYLKEEHKEATKSLILSMINKNYKERIPVKQVKAHHIFWDAKKKIDFLQTASNFLENRRKHDDVINQLEEKCEEVTGGQFWKDVICSETYNPEVKRVIEKYKGWENKTKLQDLLRSIRNWSQHYHDPKTTEKFKKEVGEHEAGFVKFFISHFPKLLPVTFDVLRGQKDEDIFKRYYFGTGDVETYEMQIDEKMETSLGAEAYGTRMEMSEAENLDDEDILPSSDEEDASSPEEPVKLTLRGYQKELAEQALAGNNSLIIAPTGSGKTAVASEIIQNHLRSGKSRGILFLVSKTTLARQQYEFFSRYLSDDLEESEAAYLIGEIATNAAVGAIIKTMKLTVLTPQILIDELNRSHSFVSIDDISLMIFDECHNASKNHPYKVIMDMVLDFRMDSPNSLPVQIVGMTASPGVGKGKTRDVVLDNLITLLANLDVRLCPAIVEKNTDELKLHQNEIEESYVRIKVEGDRFTRKILEAMGLIEARMAKQLSVDSKGKQYSKPPGEKDKQAYESWVVSLMRYVRENVTDRDISRIVLTYADHLRMYSNLLYLKKHIPNAMEITNTLAEFDQEGSVGKFLRTIRAKLESASLKSNVPMMDKLFGILKDEFQKNESSRCIIFVPRKLIAPAIVNCIKNNRELAHLEPEYLTGKNEQAAMGGMTKTKQESVIKAFRDGECKVLVATSVAEEGLDIRACNLVIMYNYVTGEVGRIQRAGRGRAANSRSVLITPQDTEQIQREKMNAICAVATEQAIKDLNRLSDGERTSRINNEQQNQRRDRQRKIMDTKRLIQEAGNWQILCGVCQNFITMANKLRHIKNQHRFVVDPEFQTRILMNKCEPIVVPWGPFEQTATFTCINNECKNYLGVEMQYREKTYPTLSVDRLIFKDEMGNQKTARQWSKCPFAVEKAMDEVDDVEQADVQTVKEFAISQAKSVSKGFNPEDISEEERKEVMAMANE